MQGRSRSELHQSKLEEFKVYCESQGWTDERTKGFYEVLRMRHPAKNKPLLVYKTIKNKEHYTIFDDSLELYLQWKRSKQTEGN